MQGVLFSVWPPTVPSASFCQDSVTWMLTTSLLVSKRKKKKVNRAASLEEKMRNNVMPANGRKRFLSQRRW